MEEKETKSVNNMETSDFSSIFMQALLIIEDEEWHSKDYLYNAQIAMWCVICIEQYHNRKVITERLYGKQDITIILSDKKLTIFLNETGQHSWCKAENIINYEDTEADIISLLNTLDFAILRADAI